ncbi:hypothetical protein RFI_04895, partial [Reticulomyxa filosa]
KKKNRKQDKVSKDLMFEFILFVVKKERKKWIKWLKRRDKKDKKEIVIKFEGLSKEDFKVWLLGQKRWKNDLTKENISVIYDVIDLFVDYYSSDDSMAYMEEDERRELKLVPSSKSSNCLIVKKVIKNALVAMIAISEYDNKEWENLPNVKEKDIKHFRELFKDELNYEFVCNKEPKMDKQDVQAFLSKLIYKYKLYKNSCNYDALIMIISGHGDKQDVLITSDGQKISVESIWSYFSYGIINSLKDHPKIFFIDIPRGERHPQTRGKPVHDGDNFLMVWSTIKGYTLGDLSLFSENIKHTIVSNYKRASLCQMLKEARMQLKENPDDSYCCLEIKDTTDYDIFFQRKPEELRK